MTTASNAGDERLLQKCDELIDLLGQHDEHGKLQALLADIQALRIKLADAARQNGD